MAESFQTTALIRQSSMPNADANVHSIEAIVSSTRIDAGYLRMDRDTSLQNFVDALIKGTQLLCCHRVSNGFGLSREGTLVDEDDASLAVGVIDIERGLPLNPPATYTNSDAYIQRIERGKIKELSVGANHARFICDICGLDMMSDWNCIHYLGRRYMIEDEDGRREVVATALVKDARLVEVSLVPRGANEDAVIIKKRLQVHIARGLLSEADAQEVLSDLGIGATLADMPSTEPYLIKKSEGEPHVEPEEILMSGTTEGRGASPPMSVIEKEELQAWYNEREQQLKEDKAALVTECNALREQVNSLRPLADIGEDTLRTLRAETLEFYRLYQSLKMTSHADIAAEVSRKEVSLKECGYQELLNLKQSYEELYNGQRSILADKEEQKQAKADARISKVQGGFRRLAQPLVQGGRQTLSDSETDPEEDEESHFEIRLS